MAKTTGIIFSSLSATTDENLKIELFGSFLSLVRGQIENLKTKQPESAELKRDVEIIIQISENDFDVISRTRDNVVACTRYAEVMSCISKLLMSIMPICVRWQLIEFPDSTRFGDYEVKKVM